MEVKNFLAGFSGARRGDIICDEVLKDVQTLPGSSPVSSSLGEGGQSFCQEWIGSSSVRSAPSDSGVTGATVVTSTIILRLIILGAAGITKGGFTMGAAGILLRESAAGITLGAVGESAAGITLGGITLGAITLGAVGESAAGITLGADDESAAILFSCVRQVTMMHMH